MSTDEDAALARAQQSLSPHARTAYHQLTSADGFYQSDLWKALDVSSRTGTRLARELAAAGLITREQTTHQGRQTYWLVPVGSAGQAASEQGEEPPTSEVDDLSPRHHRALECIREHGGLHQSELWKVLDVSSRTGTRLARALAENGHIDRVATTYQGRRTYFLSLSDDTDADNPTDAGDDRPMPISRDEESPSRAGRATTAAEDDADRVRALVAQFGRLPLSDLVRRLDRSPQEVERLVETLIEAGHIERDVVNLYGRETYELTTAD